MRVLDVSGLGWPAALCEIDGEQVLLLDADLDHDARMGHLADAMAEQEVPGSW